MSSRPVVDSAAAVGRAVERFEVDQLSSIAAGRRQVTQLADPPQRAVESRQAPYRTSTGEQLRQLTVEVADALYNLAPLVPHVVEHARRGHAFGHGIAPPTSERGEDLSHEPYAEDHSDPTGEAAVGYRRQVEDDDLRAIRHLLASLTAAAREVDQRLPAIKAALAADSNPTDGTVLSAVEAKRQLTLDAESTCLVCEQPISECGPLHAGLCEDDYAAWAASGIDRHTWLHLLVDQDLPEDVIG